MIRSIKLLGSLVIEENGRSSPLRKNAKGCALLTYLIVTQRPQSREHIADLLWEARSTAQSLRNLRVLLSRIRPLLPELQISRKEVAFRPEPETEIDYFRLAEALSAPELEPLAIALPLYDGALLANFHIEDAPRFNEWLLLERERLQHRVIGAYQQLCAAYAKQQAWQKGLEVSRQWLALDDLDERAHRWSMEFQAALGEQTAALQQYETCRQRLWQELGVEPEAATAALAQKIRMMWETAVPIATLEPTELPPLHLSGLPKPGSLPLNAIVPYRRNDNFIGRAEDLQAIAAHLLAASRSSPPVVAITGMGGLGKTQLAVEFCYRYGRYFPGGVFWFSFADESNIAQEVANIGGERGMGLYRNADKLTLADQVGRVQKAWQEPIPRLLIFDNCEEEALLAEWLPVTGGSRVLLTSRRAHWSRELQVAKWPLPVLDLPESIALLQQLASALSTVEAAEIATELGRLPLALHLAGGFLHRYQQISGSQYLLQLRDTGLLQHPSLKGRGISHSPTGHELNVARTFALNLEQLDSSDEVDAIARQLLALVANFAPGEPVPQILLLSVIIDEKTRNSDNIMVNLLFEDGLTRLVMLGFLEERAHGAIVMHRLLVAFVLRTLQEKVLEQAQLAIEKILINVLTNQRQETWGLATLTFSPSHLLHFADKVKTRSDKQAAQIVTLWGCYLRDMGAFEEAEQQFQLGLDIRRRWVGQDHMETAESLRVLANLYVRMGLYGRAQNYFDQSLAVFEVLQGDNDLKLARVLDQLGVAHMAQGFFAEALFYMERGIAIREQFTEPNQPDINIERTNLGVLYMRKGAYEAAEQIMACAVKASEALYGSKHQHTAIALNYLGDIYFYLSDLEKAWSLNERALTIREQTVGPRHIVTAFSLESLGWMLMMTDRLTEARPYLEKALAIRQDSKGVNHPKTAVSLNHMGDLLVKMGDVEGGRPYLEDALAIREQLFDPKHPDIAHNLISFADLYQATGNHHRAITYYERSLRILEEKVVDTHFDLQRVRAIMAADANRAVRAKY